MKNLKARSIFVSILAFALLFGCMQINAATASNVFEMPTAFETAPSGILTGGEAAAVTGLNITRYEGDGSVISIESEEGRGNVLKLVRGIGADNKLEFSVPVSSYSINPNRPDKLFFEYDMKLGQEDSIYMAAGYHDMINPYILGLKLFIRYCPDYQSDSYSNQEVGTITPGVWYRVKQVMDYHNFSQSVYFENLSDNSRREAENFNMTNNTAISVNDIEFTLDTQDVFADLGLTFYIDNIKVYSVEKQSIINSKPVAGAENVRADSDITITFKNDIDSSSLDKIAVTADDETVDSSIYTVSAENNIVTIKFNKEMNYKTNYNVDLSKLRDFSGSLIEAGNQFLSFTTEDVPDVQIINCKIYNGIGEDMTSFNTESGLKTMITSLVNNTASPKNVTILCALYTSDNRLYDVMYIQKDFPADEAYDVGTAFTLPPSFAGGKIRLYSWNSIEMIKPWQKGINIVIEQEG